MTNPSPDSTKPAGVDWLGPDPGLSIRRWVAMILRLGIGLTLLNVGLSGYIATQWPMGGPMTMATNTIAPLLATLPYLAIALGVALIVGFMTRVSSIASAGFVLLIPLIVTASILGSNGGFMPAMGMGRGPDQTMMVLIFGAIYLPGLMPIAALVWLSPTENHPVSIDALILGRAAPEMFIPPPPIEEPAGPTSPGA